MLVHGRNQTADYMLDIARRLDLPDVHYVALQAHENTWYPKGFMAPFEENEPWLTYALESLDARIRELADSGVDRSRIAIIGFSQGACLTAEYAARHAGRYGAIVAYTGGLIGPPGTTWNYQGSFDGTPVYFGTSDVDDWVPVERVRESEAVFRRMGAHTILCIYEGMDHLVNDEEIAEVRELILRIQFAT
ncbi:MAG: dienelactone hydrolase family protein [Alicyclobacillaceae bacterium]|nr:dienelactone hydrolase family protein [Alicyclobacillaceae bacterium]